jgi:hypothetical protein
VRSSCASASASGSCTDCRNTDLGHLQRFDQPGVGLSSDFARPTPDHGVSRSRRSRWFTSRGGGSRAGTPSRRLATEARAAPHKR